MAAVEWKDLSITSFLGSGALGSVYSGLWNDASVAIKELHTQEFEDDALASLESDAAAYTSLEHANVGKVTCVCTESPNLCIVSELQSKSLTDLLADDASSELSDGYRIHLMAEAANGLQYLHSKDVVHGDVSSSNAVLDKDGTVKLIDYGFLPIKMATREDQDDFMNKVAWSAPEVMNGDAPTKESDVYSLGVLLNELWSKVPPFEGEDNDTIREMTEEGVRPEVAPGTPDKLDALLQQCWEAEPSARPSLSTVLATLADLKDVFPYGAAAGVDGAVAAVADDEADNALAALENKMHSVEERVEEAIAADSEHVSATQVTAADEDGLAVRGSFFVNHVIDVSGGASAAPDAAFKWYRAQEPGAKKPWKSIPGANKRTYRPTAIDFGTQLKAVVKSADGTKHEVVTPPINIDDGMLKVMQKAFQAGNAQFNCVESGTSRKLIVKVSTKDHKIKVKDGSHTVSKTKLTTSTHVLIDETKQGRFVLRISGDEQFDLFVEGPSRDLIAFVVRSCMEDKFVNMRKSKSFSLGGKELTELREAALAAGSPDVDEDNYLTESPKPKSKPTLSREGMVAQSVRDIPANFPQPTPEQLAKAPEPTGFDKPEALRIEGDVCIGEELSIGGMSDEAAYKFRWSRQFGNQTKNIPGGRSARYTPKALDYQMTLRCDVEHQKEGWAWAGEATNVNLSPKLKERLEGAWKSGSCHVAVRIKEDKDSSELADGTVVVETKKQRVTVKKGKKELYRGAVNEKTAVLIDEKKPEHFVLSVSGTDRFDMYSDTADRDTLALLVRACAEDKFLRRTNSKAFILGEGTPQASERKSFTGDEVAASREGLQKTPKKSKKPAAEASPAPAAEKASEPAPAAAAAQTETETETETANAAPEPAAEAVVERTSNYAATRTVSDTSYVGTELSIDECDGDATFKWYRNYGDGFKGVPGATKSAYTPTAVDFQAAVRCEIKEGGNSREVLFGTVQMDRVMVSVLDSYWAVGEAQFNATENTGDKRSIVVSVNIREEQLSVADTDGNTLHEGALTKESCILIDDKRAGRFMLQVARGRRFDLNSDNSTRNLIAFVFRRVMEDKFVHKRKSASYSQADLQDALSKAQEEEAARKAAAAEAKAQAAGTAAASNKNDGDMNAKEAAVLAAAASAEAEGKVLPTLAESVTSIMGDAYVGYSLRVVGPFTAEKAKVRWERSLDGGESWRKIAGATNAQYEPTAVDYEALVRVQVDSSPRTFSAQLPEVIGLHPSMAKTIDGYWVAGKAGFPAVNNKAGGADVKVNVYLRDKQFKVKRGSKVLYEGPLNQDVAVLIDEKRKGRFILRCNPSTQFDLTAQGFNRELLALVVRSVMDQSERAKLHRAAMGGSDDAVVLEDTGALAKAQVHNLISEGLQLSGEPIVGKQLELVGSFDRAACTYKWLRNVPERGWKDIPGATADVYTPCAVDYGMLLRCEVTDTAVYEVYQVESTPVNLAPAMVELLRSYFAKAKAIFNVTDSLSGEPVELDVKIRKQQIKLKVGKRTVFKDGFNAHTHVLIDEKKPGRFVLQVNETTSFDLFGQYHASDLIAFTVRSIVEQRALGKPVKTFVLAPVERLYNSKVEQKARSLQKKNSLKLTASAVASDTAGQLGVLKVVGKPLVAYTLTVTGDFNNNVCSFQWQRSYDGVTYKDIPAADGVSYTATAVDMDALVRVQVTPLVDGGMPGPSTTLEAGARRFTVDPNMRTLIDSYVRAEKAKFAVINRDTQRPYTLKLSVPAYRTLTGELRPKKGKQAIVLKDGKRTLYQGAITDKSVVLIDEKDERHFIFDTGSDKFHLLAEGTIRDLIALTLQRIMLLRSEE